MRAVTWHGRRDVRVDTVPDPEIRPARALGSSARAALEGAPRAYEMFQKKQDGMVKVVLRP